MELLEEYQSALEKIKSLEDKLRDYKEAVNLATSGLNLVSNSLKEAADNLFAEKLTPRLELIRDELFIFPSSVLNIVNNTLHIPDMSEEEQQKAKGEIAKIGFELLKKKLNHMNLKLDSNEE